MKIDEGNWSKDGRTCLRTLALVAWPGGYVSAAVDPGAFRRLLRERCLTGEQLRKRTGLSPATLAKLYRGERVSDDVFRRVVFELQGHPVVPIAQQLAGHKAGDPRAQEGAA